MIEFYEGIIKIANLVLGLIGIYISLSLFKSSYERRELRSWKALLVAFIFLMIQEILGALRAFGFFESPFLTHIVPTATLAFLAYALIWQINIHLTEK